MVSQDFIFITRSSLNSYHRDTSFKNCAQQDLLYSTCTLDSVNPRFKPWGSINFIIHINLGLNLERAEIET